MFGTRVDILLRGEDTGGAYCTYEVTVDPQQGPPPHVHDHEDEAFYILDGTFEVLSGDQVTTLEAGSYVFLPRHVPHAFKNVGETTGRLLGTATPAGHERFFEDADALHHSGTFSPETAVALCRRHGMEMLLPEPAAL